jgi:hypothetical protein
MWIAGLPLQMLASAAGRREDATEPVTAGVQLSKIQGGRMAIEITRSHEGKATHFVLTRFNVRNFYHHAEPTDEWLRERMVLFRRYCMPSFRAQSVNTFHWLVFFDSKTPEWLRTEVQTAAQDLFEPVFVEGPFSKELLTETITERCSTPFAITTRVDNDDAVAVDFIEKIQSCFAEQDLTFVNLVNGAQYAEGKTYLRPYTKNPFSTLIEDISVRPPATVFVEHHYRIDDFAPVLNVRTSHPMWLQVIHGGNVLNELVGLRVAGRTVAPYFPCSLDIQDSALSLAADRMRGSIRIMLRLLRRPHRFIELSRSVWARKTV